MPAIGYAHLIDAFGLQCFFGFSAAHDEGR